LQRLLRLGNRDRKIGITSQRRLVYQYQAALREDPEAKGRPTPMHGPKLARSKGTGAKFGL